MLLAPGHTVAVGQAASLPAFVIEIQRFWEGGESILAASGVAVRLRTGRRHKVIRRITRRPLSSKCHINRIGRMLGALLKV